MNRIKRYESLIEYHSKLRDECAKLKNVEGEMYHKGMIDAYRGEITAAS